jgi:hypothetical protein
VCTVQAGRHGAVLKPCGRGFPLRPPPSIRIWWRCGGRHSRRSGGPTRRRSTRSDRRSRARARMPFFEGVLCLATILLARDVTCGFRMSEWRLSGRSSSKCVPMLAHLMRLECFAELCRRTPCGPRFTRACRTWCLLHTVSTARGRDLVCGP